MIKLKVKERACIWWMDGRCWWGSGTHVDELLLILVGHVSQAVVASGQVSLQAGQGLDTHALHLAALGSGAGGGQAQAADAAAGTDAGRQHVVLIEHPRRDLQRRARVEDPQHT